MEAGLRNSEPRERALRGGYPEGGAYSIRITASGFGGSSSGTALVPDAHEPDNDSAGATPLALNVVQDHSLSIDDVDWYYFDVP